MTWRSSSAEVVLDSCWHGCGWFLMTSSSFHPFTDSGNMTKGAQLLFLGNVAS